MGNPASTPAGGELYDIIKMHTKSADEMVVNPETYAVLSTAYWYTLNTPPASGNRVEFYAYFSTRG